MSFLKDLTPESMLNDEFPLNEILKNSLYYPCSRFNGDVIKNCNTERQQLDIISFIYCDHQQSLDGFLFAIDLFAGYNVFAYRTLNVKDLVPNGYQFRMPPRLNKSEYPRNQNLQVSFAVWVVFERKEQRDHKHGQERFSLIYICGEGIATYQAIYWGNKKSPKVIALIDPQDYVDNYWQTTLIQSGSFEWTIENNMYGKPDFILYNSSNITNLNWRNYSIIDGRYISLWKRHTK